LAFKAFETDVDYESDEADEQDNADEILSTETVNSGFEEEEYDLDDAGM